MATEQQLMKALREADAANDTRAAQLFASKIKELRASQLTTNTPEILNDEDVPTPENLSIPAPGSQDRSLTENITGLGEAALTMATGATGGALGYLASAPDAALNELRGKEGGFDNANEMAAEMTYSPRSDAGKLFVKSISETLGVLPPVMGSGGMPAALNTSSAVSRVVNSKLFKGSRERRQILVDEIKAGNRNIDNITQALDSDGKLISNPSVKKASQILGDNLKGKQHAIELDLMSKADRGQLNKMLTIVENQRRLGTRYAMENRPSNVVGESIADRIKAVIQLKNKSNKELSQVLDSDVGRELVITSEPSRKFFDNLESEGVEIGRNEAGKLTVNLDNSTARLGDVLPKAELERVLNMLDVDEMTIAKAHKMKRFVREYVSYDGGIQVGAKTSKPIENAIKSLSNGINDAISQKSPVYAKANARFASVIDSISLAQKQLKGMDIDTDLANSKLGNLSKKLGTNYGTKENVFKLIDTLDESLVANKIKFNDDIRSQVSSLALLDDVFRMQETETPYGFVSGIAKGTRDTAAGQSVSMQALDAAVGKLKSMRDPDFNKKMAVLREFAGKK